MVLGLKKHPTKTREETLGIPNGSPGRPSLSKGWTYSAVYRMVKHMAAMDDWDVHGDWIITPILSRLDTSRKLVL